MRGDPVGEAELVAFDAAVADAAVAAGDEPGDGSFDHGPPLPVVVGEVAVAPRSAGFDEFGVVIADVEHPSVLRGGASSLQAGSRWQRAPNVALPWGRSVTVCPAGQVAVRAPVVDDEVVAVEPAGDGSP